MSGSIKDNPFLKNQFKKKEETPVLTSKPRASSKTGPPLAKSSTNDGEILKEQVNPVVNAPTAEKIESNVKLEEERKEIAEEKPLIAEKIEALIENKAGDQKAEPSSDIKLVNSPDVKLATAPEVKEDKEEIFQAAKLESEIKNKETLVTHTEEVPKPAPEKGVAENKSNATMAAISKPKDEKSAFPIIIINNNTEESAEVIVDKINSQFDSLGLQNEFDERKIAEARLSRITEVAEEEKVEDSSFHAELGIDNPAHEQDEHGNQNLVVSSTEKHEEEQKNEFSDEYIQKRTDGLSEPEDLEHSSGNNKLSNNENGGESSEKIELEDRNNNLNSKEVPSEKSKEKISSSVAKKKEKEQNKKAKLSPNTEAKQGPEKINRGKKDNQKKEGGQTKQDSAGNPKKKDRAAGDENAQAKKNEHSDTDEKIKPKKNEQSDAADKAKPKKNERSDTGEKVKPKKSEQSDFADKSRSKRADVDENLIQKNPVKKSPDTKRPLTAGAKKLNKKVVLEKDLFENLETLKTSEYFETEHHETEGDYHMNRISPRGQNTFMNMSMILSSPKSVKECNLTVHRLYESLVRTEEKRAKKREEFLDEEMKATKIKPGISKGSQVLIKKNGLDEQEPIQDRTKKILEKMKEKNQKIKDLVEKKKEENLEEPTFQPILVAKATRQVKSRTLKEFNEFQTKWKEQAEQEILRTRYEHLSKTLAEVSFKPTINEYSKKLIENKKNAGDPVEKRLLENLEESKKKKLKKLEELQPTFRPTLNPKTQEIIKKKKERKKTGEIKSLDLRHYQEEFLSKEIFYRQPTSQTKKDASKTSSKATAVPSNQGEGNSSLIIHKSLNNVPPLFDSIHWGDSTQEKVNEINYSSNMDFFLNKINGN